MANILPVEGQVGWNRLMTEDAEKRNNFTVICLGG